MPVALLAPNLTGPRCCVFATPVSEFFCGLCSVSFASSSFPSLLRCRLHPTALLPTLGLLGTVSVGCPPARGEGLAAGCKDVGAVWWVPASHPLHKELHPHLSPLGTETGVHPRSDTSPVFLPRLPQEHTAFQWLLPLPPRCQGVQKTSLTSPRVHSWRNALQRTLANLGKNSALPKSQQNVTRFEEFLHSQQLGGLADQHFLQTPFST